MAVPATIHPLLKSVSIPTVTATRTATNAITPTAGQSAAGSDVCRPGATAADHDCWQKAVSARDCERLRPRRLPTMRIPTSAHRVAVAIHLIAVALVAATTACLADFRS